MNIGLLAYSDRLAKIKLTTLGERRIQGDLIKTFKIVYGILLNMAKIYSDLVDLTGTLSGKPM